MSQDKEREAWQAEVDEAKALHRVFSPESVERLVRAALASQQAVKGEPVAWLCRRENGILDVLTDQTCKQCFPVYASTPSREPLTEWEARGMLARLKCWHRLTEQEADELVQFAMQGGIHSRGEGEKA